MLRSAYLATRQLLAVFLILLLPAQALAATRTWDGGGADTKWTTAGNWSNDIVPTAGDNALFDGTSTKDATISVATTVGGIEIRSGYTGTISQSGGTVLTVGTGSLVMGGGTFRGGTGSTVVRTGFTLSGGTLIAPQRTFSVAQDFAKTGGTFMPNQGTLVLTPQSAQTFTPGGTGYGNVAVNDGLVGYWKFDETSGTVAVDSSIYGNNAMLVSGPTPSTTIAPVSFTNPRSLLFDGTGDYVDNATLHSSVYTAPFTVALWVNGATNAPGNSLVSSRSTGNSGWAFDLNEYYNSGTLGITFYGVANYDSAIPAPTGWGHLVAVINPSGGNT